MSSATNNRLDELDKAATQLRLLRERARHLASAVRLSPGHRVQLRRALEAATIQAATRYRALADAAANLPPAADRAQGGAHRKG
jgi:hypothetical protein